MKNKTSIYVIVAISLAVALLHVVIRPDYNGIFRDFILGYLMDILLPMDVYLLLQISLRKQMPVKTARILGALITLLIGASTEILQLYGFKIFGSTYDPLDLVMYAIGISAGVVIDMTIINRFESKGNGI